MEEIFLEDSDSGLYVSNLGRVVGVSGVVYNCRPTRNGYTVIGYVSKKTKKMTSKSLHRLVAENFIPNPRNLPQVNHKDEDKSNNRVDNLEWCNSFYNQKYGTINERRIKTRNERNGKNKEKRIALIKGKERREFKSLAEASRTLRISSSHLTSLLARKKGFRTVSGWRLDGTEFFSKEKPLKLENVETGELKEFISRQKASDFLGCDSSNMMKKLKKKKGANEYKGWRLAK